LTELLDVFVAVRIEVGENAVDAHRGGSLVLGLKASRQYSRPN
jgi:hypothetical protein